MKPKKIPQGSDETEPRTIETEIIEAAVYLQCDTYKFYGSIQGEFIVVFILK